MIYVLSDIHGNKVNFESILDMIRLQPEDSLYVLGDVIDRYPYGVQILQQIMKMPNAYMVLGNHEWMMMKALNIKSEAVESIIGSKQETYKHKIETLALWYGNGGEPTHTEWNKLSENEREEIAGYLMSIPLSYEVEIANRKFKLVHAVPIEFYQRYNSSKFQNAIEYAVWERKLPEYPLDTDTDYTIIFGHTPTFYLQDSIPLKIWESGNKIGIDCGSGFPKPTNWFQVAGRLACIRLDDMQTFYSK